MQKYNRYKPYKDKQEEIKKRDIRNYEENLKLNYEATRRDFDILFRTVIPMQKNLVKTYLWFNTLIIGFIFAVATKLGVPFFLSNKLILLCTIICALPSVLSLTFSIGTLLEGRKKFFAHADINMPYHIKNDEEQHVVGIIKMTKILQTAFCDNNKIVKSRGAYLRWALICLCTSFVLLITSGCIILYFFTK